MQLFKKKSRTKKDYVPNLNGVKCGICGGETNVYVQNNRTWHEECEDCGNTKQI